MDKKDKKPNVPNLRFDYLSWNSDLLSKFTYKITEKNRDSKIKNVICNSANVGLIPQIDYFDKAIANNENIDGYYIIRKNDFVYNPRKSSNAPYGPINIYTYDTVGVVSPLYLCFKVKGINKKYLYYYFRGNSWHRYMYMNGDSGARSDRVSIKDDVFFNMPISFPDNTTQEKIAHFLTLIDRRIETQIKIIEETETYINRIKEKILNNFSSNLNLSLNELCQITTGKLDANAMVTDGEYRFYTCAEKYYYIDKYAFDTEALLISGNGANVGYIHYYKGKFNAYQRTYVLTDFNANPLIIKLNLDVNLKRRINEQKNTGNTPYIKIDTIANMKIKLFDKDDELTVLRLIESLERKKENNNRLLELLSNQKDFLLKNMFV